MSQASEANCVVPSPRQALFLPHAVGQISMNFDEKSLQGSFVIDSSLPVPKTVMPPGRENSGLALFPGSENHPDGHFKTFDTDLEITLLLRGDTYRTYIKVENVRVSLPELASAGKLEVAIPKCKTIFNITVCAKGCVTRFFLPVGFVGMIKGGTLEALYLSPAIEKECSSLRQDMKCPANDCRFIGQYNRDENHSEVTLKIEKDTFQDVWIQYYGEKVPQDIISTSQDLVVRWK